MKGSRRRAFRAGTNAKGDNMGTKNETAKLGKMKVNELQATRPT